MSETPRTDALTDDKGAKACEFHRGPLAALEHHARQLERELAAAQRELRFLRADQKYWRGKAESAQQKIKEFEADCEECDYHQSRNSLAQADNFHHLKAEIEEFKDLANGPIEFAREMLPICPEKARKMIEYATEKGREMRSNATAEIERLKAEVKSKSHLIFLHHSAGVMDGLLPGNTCPVCEEYERKQAALAGAGETEKEER